MSVQNAPIFGLLRDTMGFLTQRQKVLAENVANANTPGYVPRDISGGAFEQALARRMSTGVAPKLAVTAPGHIVSPSAPALRLRAESAPDSEATIDGNAVVLEEQMGRVVDTQMRYETVLGLYQKSLGLVRMAAKSPSR